MFFCAETLSIFIFNEKSWKIYLSSCVIWYYKNCTNIIKTVLLVQINGESVQIEKLLVQLNELIHYYIVPSIN